ncbi:uncharacterized protein [Choristoneura fumiferana]|uniref:uncharacterized protein n=1 Tax=Choristoneura fumiferana TaxID=7141 RepID=UPI003D15751E
MVQNRNSKLKTTFKERQINIKADVIILGCSLPGIVTAHKLKKKFGKTMDIVVLDLAAPTRILSKGNVAFESGYISDDEESDDSSGEMTTRQFADNAAKHFLSRYAKEFSIPLPDAIMNPRLVRSPLNKLFQFRDGNIVECNKDYHDFDYLNVVERFELNQYHDLLDQNTRDLFQTNRVSCEADRRKLLYYDQTTMERHICGNLLFPTSREIMRMSVSLVCGAPSNVVSVLFYLHQCHRTSSARNHFDGNNTRFREKLLGFCRKQVASKLQQSVSDITFPAIAIQKIRIYSDEQVILETMKGDTNYVCNLLAMALKPEQLLKIAIEDEILTEKQATMIGAMLPGKVKKFFVQYNESFWEDEGYSGDILSIRGPIVWAMARPRLSTTGSIEKYAALVGYLMVRDDVEDSREAVLEQLTKLYGEAAAKPINYKESDVTDIFVPRCGDYVALRQLTSFGNTGNVVEWGAMDIFADGDVAAALEAGHNAYLHVLTSLRPQAQTFEDLATTERPTILDDGPLTRWAAYLNYISSIQIVAYATAMYVGFRCIRSYLRR